jgi:hypothetical protein
VLAKQARSPIAKTLLCVKKAKAKVAGNVVKDVRLILISFSCATLRLLHTVEMPVTFLAYELGYLTLI